MASEKYNSERKVRDNLGTVGGANSRKHTHVGTSGATEAGLSQGAKMPYHNGTPLPHKEHVHSITIGTNSDGDDAYNNAPAYVSLYFIIRIR